ncbi:Hint domain-containing protein [Bradyrhizobium jicamae]|uniref:Hint domain-containing protein n=1 Tax=Bradyrhizobium jicamae TaxID=280332 RepID=UPI001BA8211B|nr:Hint domain-containing protein [Bradyrhizobium jicamae]MBR0750728.1 Hint domain-containing protein [Bradyrhizobium jicamae]
MPVTDAKLTAISPDTGTAGDFETSANALTFSGTYTATGNGNQHIYVYINGSNVGEAVLDNAHKTWTFDYSGTSLPAGAYTITLASSPNNANTVYSHGTQGIEIDAVCFMAGTMIRTPDGERLVEDLKRGDLVVTVDGSHRPISWVGKQTVAMRFADKQRVGPIRILAGALGDNVPSRDLVVSPCHALYVDGILIQAGALVNGTSIVRESGVPDVFTYYHVELESHDLILSENTPSETFVDNIDRMAFDNWAEHEMLYPDGQQIVELAYPRAKSLRQVPRRIRALLEARAAQIIQPASQVA